jgi:hypothetical protein
MNVNKCKETPILKRGRPPLEAGRRKDVQISVRLRPATVKLLKQVASAKHVSLAREIAERLEDSLAAMPKQPELFGGNTNYSFALLLALSLRELRERTGHWWHENPFTFQHARLATDFLFQRFKPRGRATQPYDLPATLPGTVRRIKKDKNGIIYFGAEAAAELVAAVEAYCGDYGKRSKELARQLPVEQREIVAATIEIYERIGTHLLPLRRRKLKR